MTYIGELFLKVKLQGLGWDKDGEAIIAYDQLLQNIAAHLQGNSKFVSDDSKKTVDVVICRELDREALHSIEGKGLLVLQGEKVTYLGRYSR